MCEYGCLFVNAVTLNRLRYHHEMFMGARCGQKLGQFQKWLQSDALWGVDGVLTSLMCQSMLSVLVVQLTEEVRHQMQETLQTVYGVNLDDSWNRKVTESWDKAQTLVETTAIYISVYDHILCMCM